METTLCKWYQDNVDVKARLPDKYTACYDIIVPKLNNVEVKEDLLACHTLNYAIEFEGYDKQPSGINVTTSGEFALVDNEYFIRIATDSLKYIIRNIKWKPVIGMGFTTDDGKRSKGWLIPREAILNSPYAVITKRWF